NRQLLIFVAALLWPLAQVLELLLTPELASSPNLYLIAALALITSAGLALMITRPLLQKRPPSLTLPLTGIIILAMLWVLGAQTARENTLTVASLAGLQLPPVTSQATATPPATQATAKPETSPAVDGAQLFQQKCSACHRFDQRLIGPPLNSVLEKYRPGKAKLTGFLRTPQKIDPDYPTMPNLGLTEQEAGAIADYLLDYKIVQPTPR
ncbi:MAG: cytochrome c, partial [Desulfuromonadaceae bacterium]|nr:cytochrome c [Desulfuromonadaceae bacterium]